MVEREEVVVRARQMGRRHEREAADRAVGREIAHFRAAPRAKVPSLGPLLMAVQQQNISIKRNWKKEKKKRKENTTRKALRAAPGVERESP